jgi:hypothetical protein
MVRKVAAILLGLLAVAPLLLALGALRGAVEGGYSGDIGRGGSAALGFLYSGIALIGFLLARRIWRRRS